MYRMQNIPPKDKLKKVATYYVSKTISACSVMEELKAQNSELAKALSEERRQCQFLAMTSDELTQACNSRDLVISTILNNAKVMMQKIVIMSECLMTISDCLKDTISSCQKFVQNETNTQEKESPIKDVSGHTIITSPTINSSEQVKSKLSVIKEESDTLEKTLDQSENRYLQTPPERVRSCEESEIVNTRLSSESINTNQASDNTEHAEEAALDSSLSVSAEKSNETKSSSSNGKSSSQSRIESSAENQSSMLAVEEEETFNEAGANRTYSSIVVHRRKKRKNIDVQQKLKELKVVADRVYAVSPSQSIVSRGDLYVHSIPSIPHVIRLRRQSATPSHQSSNDNDDDYQLNLRPIKQRYGPSSSSSSISSNRSSNDSNDHRMDSRSFVTRSRGPSAPGSSLRSSNNDDEDSLVRNIKSQVTPLRPEELRFDLNEMIQKSPFKPLLSMMSKNDEPAPQDFETTVTAQITQKSGLDDDSGTIGSNPTAKVYLTYCQMQKKNREIVNNNAHEKRISDMSTERLSLRTQHPNLISQDNQVESDRPQKARKRTLPRSVEPRHSRSHEDEVQVAKRRKQREKKIRDEDSGTNNVELEKLDKSASFTSSKNNTAAFSKIRVYKKGMSCRQYYK